MSDGEVKLDGSLTQHCLEKRALNVDDDDARACLTKLYRKSETVVCDLTESHTTQVTRAHVLN